ncbi:alpha/beta hydrolase fold-domain-containing protein [Circinella umbellata]|nr:alpha/beta hydrolase fold-domain-containing protein [Circinella umbellata]
MVQPQVILDPIYAAYCEQARSTPKLINDIDYLQQMRKAGDERIKSLNLKLPQVIEQDLTVNHNNMKIRLTLIRPPRTENDSLSVVMFYHGGGMVFGSRHTHAKLMRDICVRNHVMVIYVDYSLAPEVKCPTIHEECFAALVWVLQNGDSIKADTSNIAVCGDSAGANISAVIPLMAKERGLANAIKTQILLYPRTAVSRDHYESFKIFGKGDYGYSAAENIFFVQAYSNGEEKTIIGHPAMATQEQMKGLPSALVFIAEADILRDEGEEYVRSLMRASVPVIAVRVLGAIHAYMTVPVETMAYLQTIGMITTHLKSIFGKK